MTTATALPGIRLQPARRFFRTPKGLLLIVFAPVLFAAVAWEGPEEALPGLVLITVTASVVDIGAFATLQKRWIFPSGALLTGLILAMVLSTTTSAGVEVATAVIAIASKHLFRTRFSNVFNPAAFALVASSLLFDSAQSWWGAMAGLGLPAVLVLLAGGVFIGDRINKLPLLLSFVGTFVALFTVASFFLDPARVAEVFREPDVEALLFFAFFMVDDPPTCPSRYGDQIQFGVFVAVVSYVLFVANGAVYFLPAALLLGNAWESARRVLTRRNRAVSRR